MERLLKSEDVCQAFRISPATLWRWRQASRIVALKTPGGQLRFRESDVRRVLEEEVVATGTTG